MFTLGLMLESWEGTNNFSCRFVSWNHDFIDCHSQRIPRKEVVLLKAQLNGQFLPMSATMRQRQTPTKSSNNTIQNQVSYSEDTPLKEW